MKKEHEGFTALLVAFGGLALFAMVIIYSAVAMPFVGLKLYEWFVLPIFPTLGKFSLLHFVGFRLFAETLIIKGHISDRIKDEYKKPGVDWSIFLAAPISLLIGYIIHSMFPL